MGFSIADKLLFRINGGPTDIDRRQDVCLIWFACLLTLLVEGNLRCIAGDFGCGLHIWMENK